MGDSVSLQPDRAARAESSADSRERKRSGCRLQQRGTNDQIRQIRAILEPAPGNAPRLDDGTGPRSFREFVEQAWHVLEPSTAFVPGMHVDAICDHLQAVTEGRIRDLIINVPPGHAKSLLTAVFWPAWVWIDKPQTRWVFSAYRADLAMRDSVKCRTLIESEWYQSRWGDRFGLRDDENQKQRWANDRTGYRVIASVGAGTGERGDVVVIDDPTSVDQAESDTERKTANEWWTGTMSTRLNDLRTGHRVVIMQRLHEDDLTGNLEGRGYELLMLPQEFEPDRACVTSIGWRDPRTEPGELLWPVKNGAAEIARMKVDLGSYRYAGQYQQRPSPAGGGIFKRFWWRYWWLRHRIAASCGASAGWKSSAGARDGTAGEVR